MGFLLPGVASLHLGFASADFFLIVISSSLQFPGWSQGAEGSLVIALGNEDALGEYACTPYNSLGTAGPSPVTRVLLKVRPRVSHSGGAGGRDAPCVDTWLVERCVGVLGGGLPSLCFLCGHSSRGQMPPQSPFAEAGAEEMGRQSHGASTVRYSFHPHPH